MEIAGKYYGGFGRQDTSFSDTLCLAAGCYDIIVKDTYGDGLDGSVSVTAAGEIIRVGDFQETWRGELCVGVDNPVPGCVVPLNESKLFGLTIDQGTLQADTVLRLRGNAWAEVVLDSFDVTENTTLSFWMRSTSIGEIGGIGLGRNGTANRRYIFNLYGTQNYGIRDFIYKPSNWVYFEINLATYMAGTFDRVVFVADDDNFRNSDYEWYDVRLGENCGTRSEPPSRLSEVFRPPLLYQYNILGQLAPRNGITVEDGAVKVRFNN